HILLISKTLKLESNIERRTAAQGIAVALALDPSNREARDLSAQLVEEKTPVAPETEEVESAKSSVWKTLAWLESSESGLDGQKLGECLTDVMAVTDPSNPRSKPHLESGSSGEWDGWIPALASYDKSEKVTPPEIPQVEPSDPSEGKKSELLRNEAVVSTPLWTFDKDINKTALKSVKISMKAFLKEEEEFSEEPKEFRFIVEGTEDPDSLKSACRPVVNALKKMNGRLPPDGRVSLILGKGNDYLVHRNRLSISAAAAVLGDAAISGREPDATVMGVVGEDGSLKLPTYAWDRLRALSDGPGGRLVLPRAAEALLPSILAMEDPAFFMKYEVILADNLNELVEFSAKGSNGPLADAATRFAEIRSKMGTMPVAQYVANRFVRQRLSEIAQACPDHLSARMLSIQGAGERPTRLPRNILAAEIRRAIEPMSDVARDWDQSIDATKLEEVFEGCRKRLDPLERYVDTREREFFGEARALLTTVRTLARVKRTRSDYDESNPHPAAQVYDTLRSQHNKFRAELSEITGDEERKD
ncbi:MAG: hypothetical protein CFE26_11525, partial [Verrucomicrobiales bacterium VVV1]